LLPEETAVVVLYATRNIRSPFFFCVMIKYRPERSPGGTRWPLWRM